MADKTDKGKSKSRLILAPHPWPLLPENFEPVGGEEARLYYLSWPGWELYLGRRLQVPATPASPRPLLLPDVLDPERDFLTIDQLLNRASQLGAGVLNLFSAPAESLSDLMAGISGQTGGRAGPESGPLLDDRSYLALWAVSQWRDLEGERALAEAASRQRAMWADLKGEEARQDAPEPDGGETAVAPPEPDARGAYAWKCWRRLAEGLIAPGDRLLPTLAPPEDFSLLPPR